MPRRPEVIFAPCGPSLKAIRDISRTVPVVVNCANESNFLSEVASLSRPGRYTTRITFFLFAASAHPPGRRPCRSLRFGLDADAGGLLAYGASVDEWQGETVPMYVDRILKGAKPGDLPIIQPSTLELVVNVATAPLIGVKIPQPVLPRADRVVE